MPFSNWPISLSKTFSWPLGVIPKSSLNWSITSFVGFKNCCFNFLTGGWDDNPLLLPLGDVISPVGSIKSS